LDPSISPNLVQKQSLPTLTPPSWELVKRAQSDRARTILKRIGGAAYAEKTVIEIASSLNSENSKDKKASILSRSMFPILLIGVVLALFQQWCGINVIFLYAEEVFSAAGYAVSDMLFNVMITGSVNLIFTLVALLLVDRIGRKKPMLIGAGGLAMIYAIVGTLYFTGSTGMPLLIFVVAAIACYAMTLAPVTWVVLSEVFPNRVRGAAMAVSTFALWSGNALLDFRCDLCCRLLLYQSQTR
jgi:Na+/melibiose symporter-like transporter